MPGASQDPRTARLPMKPADPSLPFSLDGTGVRSPGGPEPHVRPGLGTLAECHPLWEPRSTRGGRAAPAAGGVVPSKPGRRGTASGSESAPGGQMARPATLLITSRRQLPGPRDKDESGVCVRCHLTSAGGSRGFSVRSSWLLWSASWEPSSASPASPPAPKGPAPVPRLPCQLEAAQAGYLMSFFGVLQMAARSGPSCSAGVGPPRHRAQPRPDPSPRGCCSKPTVPRALPVCLVEVAGDQVFQGLVIGRLSSRFSEGALLRASVLAFSVVGLAMALMANVFHLCLLMPGLVFSLCALNVVTDSMLTNAVSASDTGTMLGLCASVQPLTRTLGPTLGGLLYHSFGVPVFGHVQLAVNFLVLLVLWRQPVPPKMDKAW
ncbi:solute carrier family 22 member 18 isoform X12 [Orcinus orca]|uniref:solute carrier family 22 member 18 isoform X12 n=1 Tax=Orcinus orca TaxID=9733 RepID=UPI0014416BE4|nr:solute carrier family 22 member 18 isoform X12 [Orcinus orca]